MDKNFAFFLWIVLLWYPQCSTANPITYEFHGWVRSIQTELSGSFHFGDLVSGSLTFESASQDIQPDISIGFYQPSITTFVFTINGQNYSIVNGIFGPEAFIQVLDNWSHNPTLNQYEFGGQMQGPVVLPDLVPRLLLVSLSNSTDASSIVGDSLPGAYLTLANFSGEFSFAFGDPLTGPNFRVEGPLTSFSAISNVPEPATYTLICFGLFGLIFRCRMGAHRQVS